MGTNPQNTENESFWFHWNMSWITQTQPLLTHKVQYKWIKQTDYYFWTQTTATEIYRKMLNVAKCQIWP